MARKVQTILTVPMLFGQQMLGALTIRSQRDRDFRQEEKELAVALTQQATLALQFTRLAEEAKQAAIAREQEKAASEGVTELAKANDALKRSLDALSSDPDLDRFIGHVLKVVAEQLNAPVTEYWSVSGNIACLELSCWQGKIVTKEWLSQDPRTRGIEIPPEMVNHEALEQRQHHFSVEDLITDPIHIRVFSPLGFDMEAWCRERGVRKNINIPLRLGNKSIGALVIYTPADCRFSEQQIELSYALAQQVTLAIRLSQLAEEAKLAAITEQEKAATERAVQLAKANNALKRNLDSLATQPELEAFLQCVINEAAAQTRAESVYLFLYEEHTDSLSLSVASDNGGDWRSLSDTELWKHPFPANCTPARETITNSRTPVVLELAQANPLFWPGTFEWHQQRGHTRVIVATLWLGEQPLGFLGLSFTAGESFTPEELELIQALAQQATLAIELTRLAEQSRHTAILEERNRMAQEIHDTLAQALTSIIVRLQTASLILEAQDEVRTCIDAARELARQGLSEARRSVQALRPEALELHDLPTALRHLAQQMTADTSVQTTVRVEGSPCALPIEVENNLLRIGQEALTNILKHAQAQTVRLELQFDIEAIRLQIVDDGRGFEPQFRSADRGFGLMGMQERAQRLSGQLTITSSMGQGTAISVTVPLPQLQPHTVP